MEVSELYTIVTKGTTEAPQFVVTFDSPRAYSMYEAHTHSFYAKNDQVETTTTVNKNSGDKESTSTIVRKSQDNSKLYTINMYQSTHRFLVNGPQASTTFLSHLGAVKKFASELSPTASESGLNDTLVAEDLPADLFAQVTVPPVSQLVGTPNSAEHGRHGCHDDTPSREDHVGLAQCSSCERLEDRMRELERSLNYAYEKIEDLQVKLGRVSNKSNVCTTEQLESMHTTIRVLSERIQKVEATPNRGLPTIQSPMTNRTVPTVSTHIEQRQTAGSRPTESDPSSPTTRPQRKAWAPERCVCVYDIDDREASQSFAGVRAALSQSHPNVKIETVHRPRNGNILVQLDSAEDVQKVLESWNTETFVKSKARALVMRKPSIRRYITGIPQETTEQEVVDALREVVECTNISAHRLMRGEQATGTMCILLRDVSDETKLDEVWITTGHISLKLERPYTKQRRSILQCDRCQVFGHTIYVCKMKKDTCAKCRGPHNVTECSDDSLRCVNCNQMHSSRSTSCPARQRIIEILSRRQDA